jgi:hypothetical protein
MIPTTTPATSSPTSDMSITVNEATDSQTDTLPNETIINNPTTPITHTKREDWEKLIPSAIDVDIIYPLTCFTDVYNPARPWILTKCPNNCRIKTGSLIRINKTNTNILYPNNSPQTEDAYAYLEKITNFTKGFIDFYATTDPSVLRSAIYIRIPYKWVAMSIPNHIQYTIAQRSAKDNEFIHYSQPDYPSHKSQYVI